MKRKASRSSHYERPAKIVKNSTETTVSRTLSVLHRDETKPGAPLPPPKWPTLRPIPPLSSESPVASVPPSTTDGPGRASPLRRAPTLPLEEPTITPEHSPPSERASTRRGDSVVASLAKKGSTSTLDDGGNVTTVKRLPSGTTVGEMTALGAAPEDVRRELSKATSVASGKPTGEDSATSRHASREDGLENDVEKEEEEHQVEEQEVSDATASLPLAVPLPPGGLIEIAFSFDTTGSMNQCLEEVRGRVGDMIQRLQADIPGIRIAVIAHGDYCDEATYIIKWIDFGSSLPEMCDFVQKIGPTGGGDSDECYELVLARARSELSWTPGSQRSLVLIGDAEPHPFSYYADRAEKLDWEEEAEKLADMGVKIYAVQALNRSESTHFYRSLAKITKGRHLKLDQFNNIFDIIMAVCYRERGVEFVEAYEEEVREREGGAALHKDLEYVFGTLRGGAASTSKVSKVAKTAAKPVLLKGAAKRPLVKGKPRATASAKKTGRAVHPLGKVKATRAAKQAATSTSPAKTKGKATDKKSKNRTTVKPSSKKTKVEGVKTKAKAKENRLKGKALAKNAKGKGLKAVAHSKKAKIKKGEDKKLLKTKTSKPHSSKMFREIIQDLEFEKGKAVEKVQWGPWKLAMQPAQPQGSGCLAWKPRRNGGPGVRNVKLVQRLKQGSAPALYEFGVKLKKKLYVLYFHGCASWRRRVVWDTLLLNKPALDREIDAVLEGGGSLFLRRGEIKDVASLRKVDEHLKKTYDYAWAMRQVGQGNQGHRHLRKNGILISGNKS